MPAVGVQMLNDWTRTAETAEWASTVSVLCFWAIFHLMLSTQKPDLPSYRATAWGILLFTSDSTHIISKLLFFSIYHDGHLWREEIPGPRAIFSVSLFIATVNKGHLQSILTKLFVLLMPINWKVVWEFKPLFGSRCFSESNFIPRSSWPLPIFLLYYLQTKNFVQVCPASSGHLW